MFFESTLFNWVLLPLLIYLSRIVDVTLGTMRIISLSRGLRKLAPILGFIEILIWLMAIRQIFSHLNNPVCYIAYAGGFATGIYTGMWIEHRVAMGFRVIRIITRYDAVKLIAALREKGFGLTVVDGEGNNGPVKILFTLVKRRDIPEISSLIHHYNPKAFFSIEDIRSAEQAILPMNTGAGRNFWSQFIKYEKKAK